MNSLEIAAMLDKITEVGGSFHIKDGELFGRDVPMRFHGFIKNNKTMIMRIIERQNVHQIPVAHKRAVLRFELVKGGGNVSGSDDDNVATLLESLREKWGSELIGAWHEDVRIYP